MIFVVFYLDELSGQSTLLDKTVYGVENSSTFLECSPKSQRAMTYWQYQRSTVDRKQEVGRRCLCTHFICIVAVDSDIIRLQSTWVLIEGNLQGRLFQMMFSDYLIP